MTSGIANTNKLILMFAYDKELHGFWNKELLKDGVTLTLLWE